MKLDLVDGEPVFQSKHRLSRPEWEFIDNKGSKLGKCGLVEPATGHYAVATVLPAKKDANGNYTHKRMRGDYRALVAKT